MYQFFYDFVFNNLIGLLPSGVTDSYINQLGMILTHVSLILMFVACVFFVIWLFKWFSGILLKR